jgi:hypothetical protein
VGLIHAERIGLSLTPITAGYLVLTALLAIFYLVRSRGNEAEKEDTAEHKANVE